MEDIRKILKYYFDIQNINIDDEKINKFQKYYELLLEWNKKINLTRIVEGKDVCIKHFCDSLALSKVIEPKGKLIDVGTGGGFPGIPLKIMYPNLKITLLDSLDKRIKFLKTVCDELELENVECIHGRAEDFGKDENYREQYDMCVSRAVANLSVLSEYCMPFVSVGSIFVSYKSEDSEEEISKAQDAIDLLGGFLKENVVLELPDNKTKRRIVIIEKKNNTPIKYPRKAGKPEKKPL